MYCTQCGNQLSDDSKFCMKCGTKLVVEETENISDFKQNESFSEHTQSNDASPEQPNSLDQYSNYSIGNLINRAILQEYKMQEKKGGAGGCASIMFLFLGVGLCFIPVIGWIFGPLLIIVGLIFLFMPVRASILFDSIFSRPEYVNIKKIIVHKLSNNIPYHTICPVCKGALTVDLMIFYNNNYLHCPLCGNDSKKWLFTRFDEPR